VFAAAGGTGGATGGGATSLTPAAVAQLPEPIHGGVVDAYANALAPALWYLVPLMVIGFVLTLFLREVRLSDVAGMVARGEAVMEVAESRPHDGGADHKGGAGADRNMDVDHGGDDAVSELVEVGNEQSTPSRP